MGVNAAQLIQRDTPPEDETKSVEYLTIINKLTDIKLTMGGSATKGGVTESVIYENICKLFPYAEVDHIGKIANKGDLVVRLNGHSIMIEVKNYNKNVPSCEQTKFTKDLVSNEYDAGIMISIGNGIAHRSSAFEYEMIGNKFAVYISNANMDGVALCWAILFITASMDITNKLKDHSSETKAVVTTYVENKLSVIKDCIVDNDNIKRTLSDMSITLKRTIDNEVTRCGEGIQTANYKLAGLVADFTKLIKTGELTTDMSLMCAKEAVVKPVCDMSRAELNAMAKTKGIKKIANMKKQELINAIESKK
jgi:hypothetical protein